jgi:two-component system phosphate regulon response regulator PhoB
MLPGMNGINFAKRLRANSDTRKIPIIMLTAKSEEDNKILGLNSGIDDYLTKPFSPKELIARINALLRRSSPELTDEPIKILDLTLDPLQHQLTIKENLIKIGPTEFKILHLFLKNLNKVFSRNQIMDKIWGNKSEIDDRTVDVHIKRLRACLAPNGYDKIIRTIRGEGYSVSEKHLI